MTYVFLDEPISAKVETNSSKQKVTKTTNQHQPNFAKATLVSTTSGSKKGTGLVEKDGQVLNGTTLANPTPSPDHNSSSPKVEDNPLMTTGSSGQATMPPNITLENVHFHFDRSGFSKEVKAVLDHHVGILSSKPMLSVLIQGHTDQEGSVKQNLRVGLRRANAVKHYLVKKGIPPKRLNVVSLGEYETTCTESTVECYQRNRRVTFSLAVLNTPIPQMKNFSPITSLGQEGNFETDQSFEEHEKPVTTPQEEPTALDKSDLPDTASLSTFQDTITTSSDLDESAGVTEVIEEIIAPIYPEPVHGTPATIKTNTSSLINPGSDQN